MVYYNNITTETPLTTTERVRTTEKPFLKDDIKFLFVPIAVILVVSILSILVYFMLKRRRMIDLRHKLLTLYDYNSDEGEEEGEPLNSYENSNYQATLDYTSSFF
ncbi:unnamed protein product [Brassicogethes aeneus]|uniref:Uncharacterized protein n=1 Tax=Brassicogethes aeneus TaxID=1431903 RepID=A0A9P0AV73_BRAAE|nr:unnamed protein product [Brassicogethes aeneus]